MFVWAPVCFGKDGQELALLTNVGIIAYEDMIIEPLHDEVMAIHYSRAQVFICVEDNEVCVDF